MNDIAVSAPPWARQTRPGSNEAVGGKPTVLFISSYFPHTAAGSSHGIYKRMDNFIDALKTVAHLDLLFYVSPDIPLTPQMRSEMEAICRERWQVPATVTVCPKGPERRGKTPWAQYISPIYRFESQALWDNLWEPPQVRAFEERLEKHPDLIVAQRLDAMFPILRSGRRVPPIWMDLDDIEHIKFIRNIRQPPHWKAKWLQYLQVPAVWRKERQAIRLSTRTFVCSETDRDYLKRWGLANVDVVPNAVRIPPASPPADKPTLLFLGNYAYGPNAAGAEWLLREVWPRVQRQLPQAELNIAGKEPERIPGYRDAPRNVQFSGFVADLDALYDQTRVVVCPILSGGGTRIKIIEAAAYGKAIVSTTLGAEGIPLVPGKEIVLSDAPDAFADSCVRLLQDVTHCQTLGHAARKVAAAHYDRGSVIERIRSFTRTLTGFETQRTLEPATTAITGGERET